MTTQPVPRIPVRPPARPRRTGSVVVVERIRPSREPALLLIGVLAPLVQLLVSFTGWPPLLVGAIEAAAVAIAGLLTAAFVARERLVPAIAGVAHALLVVALHLGVPLDPTQRALVMTLVGIVSAAFVRTQVEARTPMSRPRRAAHARRAA